MRDGKSLVDELHRLGIVWWREGDRIRYRAIDSLSPDLLEDMRRLKDYLLNPPAPPPLSPPPVQVEELLPLPMPLLPSLATPRVLFASHDLSLTGAPLYLANLLPRLRGLTPSVYSPVDGPLKERLLAGGVPVTHELDFGDVDLLVANTLLSAPAIAAAKTARIPCVWLIHEFHPNICGNRAAVEAVIGYPQWVYFPHPATAANYAPLRRRNVGVIYSCVQPVPIRDRTESRHSLELSPDDFCIVTMGQNEERKGQQDLRAATDGLPVRVFYVCGDPDPWKYYAAADLYVCTSRVESFGLSLQEAKQYGLPVITTTLPSCMDIVPAGVCGLHYEPGDVADLRQKIEQVRADRGLRVRLSAPAAHLPSFLEVVEQYEKAFLDAAGHYREQPIHVVYHIAGMGADWQAIVTEQLSQLRTAGLTRILATHVGTGLDWLLDESKRHGLDLTVVQHEPDVGNCEVLAMRLIERLARTSDKPVLYLHTKGVSRPLAERYYHEWRRLLMTELVIRWREHLPSLRDHDAVGVNWWSDPKGHFSGNFWLASASWLRRLPRFDGYYRDRFSCERWIGSVAGCKAKSLLCQDKKFWECDQGLLFALRQKQQGASMAPLPPRPWSHPDAMSEAVYQSIVHENEYRLPTRFGASDIILDIGSHVGSFAHACLVRGAGYVLCVEPNPALWSAWWQNVGWDTRVRLLPLAAHAEAGALRLSIPEDERHSAGGRISESGEIEANAVAFDSLIDGTIRLCKLDCEGSEWPILRSSQRLHLVQELCGEYHLYETWQTTDLLRDLLEQQGFRAEIAPHSTVAKLGWFFARRA